MAFVDPNNHPNANNSHFLALAIIVLHVGFSVTNFLIDKSHSGFWLLLFVVSSGLSVFAALVNAKNTFETNDNWKTWVGVIAIIASLFVNFIPIAVQNGG